ncbi:MAG: ATP-binding protein [Myxococcota bacterium]
MSIPDGLTDAFACNAIELAMVKLDEVLARVASGHTDVVLLDASPAAMRVCRRIKAAPQTHFVPVLVLCPPGDAEARRRAYVEGADHVLSEPIDLDEIIARTWSLLRTYHLFKGIESKRQDLKMRRDWVRYLVHDLGNMLAKVVYNVLYLRRRLGDSDEDTLGVLSDLEQSVDRSIGMLRDVLDVDRLRQGRLPIRPEEIAVLEVVQQVADRIARFAREHQVSVRVAGCALRVRSDRSLLERILQNLFENSIRFSPPGEDVVVHVEPGEGEVRVSVANRGPAIGESNRDRIFQPFIRLDDAGGSGAGLGLAFARLALEAQRGRIWVDDPPGGGTMFSFALPLPH